MARKTSADEQPYGNNDGAWHQQVPRSSECDSLGGVSKAAQVVQQDAAAVAHPHEPTVKGKLSLGHASKSFAAYNQVTEPSSGGTIPRGKSAVEGQGANYHQNRNQTKIAGDGKATERTVMDKPKVRRTQANANNDVSSRKK